jgi:hypothetical protein
MKHKNEERKKERTHTSKHPSHIQDFDSLQWQHFFCFSCSRSRCSQTPREYRYPQSCNGSCTWSCEHRYPANKSTSRLHIYVVVVVDGSIMWRGREKRRTVIDVYKTHKGGRKKTTRTNCTSVRQYARLMFAVVAEEVEILWGYSGPSFPNA